MSLLERSQKISNPKLVKGQVQFGNLGNSKSNNDVLVLKKQVGEFISSDKLAEYIALNPVRAQAEIRNAASKCFMSPR